MSAPKFYWCDNEFESRADVERAIAQSLVDYLCDGDAGAVERGDCIWHIEITARLVNKTKIE